MIEFGVRYVSWKVLCSFCINVFQNSSSRALIRIAGRHGRTVPERFLLSQSHPPFRDVGMERQGQTVAPKYPGRHLVWNMQHNFSQVRHALSNTDKHSRLAVFLHLMIQVCIKIWKGVLAPVPMQESIFPYPFLDYKSSYRQLYQGDKKSTERIIKTTWR